MAELVLHEDFGDDAMNEALEKHLRPVKEAGGDWDGDNHGITIWLPVHVGDTIVVNADGSVLIRRKA